MKWVRCKGDKGDNYYGSGGEEGKRGKRKKKKKTAQWKKKKSRPQTKRRTDESRHAFLYTGWFISTPMHRKKPSYLYRDESLNEGQVLYV
jgi:hypothetical protein